MKQWEGATLPRICPDCKREYLVTTVETQLSEDDVCRECWEAFDGATIEELFGSSAAHAGEEAGRG